MGLENQISIFLSKERLNLKETSSFSAKDLKDHEVDDEDVALIDMHNIYILWSAQASW